MKTALYQIDAFADRPFAGNPAAVCPLDRWLDDTLMQAIAAENNLSETAFFVPRGQEFGLRWFTPRVEVDLCGHATLAAAHVLFTELDHRADTIHFDTRSGRLSVMRRGDVLAMDFPAQPPRACAAPAGLAAALGRAPQAVLHSAQDLLAVYADEAEVRALQPDMRALGAVEARGIAATAAGEEVDFVSRFFAPRVGIDEDPVTGSAHCKLAPYWARRLGRQRLVARQLSARGGEIHCVVSNTRVELAGRALTFMRGAIELPG